MPTGTLHAVVLAGGTGTRFWPLSRALMPKQLLRIVGDRSMLALTLERATTLVPEDRIWVVTTRWQAGEIRRELDSLGLTRVRVIEEPTGKNTAAAIGLAAVHVLAEDPQSILAVFPADHHIRDAERFGDLIRKAREVASQGGLVTLGIEPTRPETGYGYIHAFEEAQMERGPACHKVNRFVEKPNAPTAVDYLADGRYYWNSGVFVWKAQTVLEDEVDRSDCLGLVRN